MGKRIFFFSRLFTIEKADSTLSNFRARVIFNASETLNVHMTRTATTMIKALDTINLGNEVDYLWVCDLKDAFWSTSIYIRQLYTQGFCFGGKNYNSISKNTLVSSFFNAIFLHV